jgi:hypothetical protein
LLLIIPIIFTGCGNKKTVLTNGPNVPISDPQLNNPTLNINKQNSADNPANGKSEDNVNTIVEKPMATTTLPQTLKNSVWSGMWERSYDYPASYLTIGSVGDNGFSFILDVKLGPPGTVHEGEIKGFVNFKSSNQATYINSQKTFQLTFILAGNNISIADSSLGSNKIKTGGVFRGDFTKVNSFSPKNGIDKTRQPQITYVPLEEPVDTIQTAHGTITTNIDFDCTFFLFPIVASL